ncbi:hypothetical protein LCGC14_1827090 [marine sediment metagenome]|uniref:Uncharacterized protein n=1 Tax=marine sediment metagenome TaxID=412755 RepID=A0A0F9GHG2_9ZZZZ
MKLHNEKYIIDESGLEVTISHEDLKKLYNKLCVDKESEDFHCNKCVLSSMFYHAGGTDEHPCVRDLCFGIWHDSMIE